MCVPPRGRLAPEVERRFFQIRFRKRGTAALAVFLVSGAWTPHLILG